MAGYGAVVEILKTAGLLKEQDGKLVANPSAIQSMSSVSLRGTVQEQEKPPIVREEQRMLVAQAFPPGISIQIQIQCTANEVESLAPKLKALLKELVEKEEPESEGKN